MSIFRMFPPIAAVYQTAVANGRTYTSTPGNYLDVPDFDAALLAANHWIKGPMVGTTAQRPATATPFLLGNGVPYLDTTLGYVVIYDGVSWRNPRLSGRSFA